jgi:hypothetical protein
MDAQLKTKDSLQITARIKQLLYISAKLLNRSIFMIFLKKEVECFRKIAFHVVRSVQNQIRCCWK